VSPLAAVAQQPIGNGLTLGPNQSDIPLEGVAQQRVAQHAGAVTLEGRAARRAMPRGVPVRVGGYTLVVDGPVGGAVLTVYGPGRRREPPAFYGFRRSLVFSGPLAPASRAGRVRVLGLDGIEAEAVEAGTVLVPVGGRRIRLRVLRLPTRGEESELQIFFQDATNGRGSYPAGRFVTLEPEGNGRYRLDFNRARNPFCAYSSAYPCPAPWRGNAIGAPVPAGERYAGGGLESPATPAAEQR
jgi:hypothetical protein